MRMTGLALLFSALSISGITAQNSSFEFWPETDIWFRINPSWRLSAFIPAANYNDSHHYDLNAYLQADYAWGKTKHLHYGRLFNENRAAHMKAWMARVGLMKGWSLGENAGSYKEKTLLAEIHRRMPLGEKFLVSQRIRTELRWLGDDSDFSYRLRYRVMVEKEFSPGKFSWVPYINVEPFWDSRYSSFNRVRIIGGTSVSWGPRLGLEGNLTYQYDKHYDTDNMFAINMILHLYFETKPDNPEDR